MKNLYRIRLALALCLAFCFSCAAAEEAAWEPKSLTLMYSATKLSVGETAVPIPIVEPESAPGKITYKSSDPTVAVVDEFGNLTALRAGKTVIKAFFSNGVSAKCKVTVMKTQDPLSYQLLEDGSGYEITGCAEDRLYVVIPAKHKGLPVTAVADRAFMDCADLRRFYTDPDQPVFYAQDGVLFTDQPVKTLVRFPNNYGAERNTYQAPADTVAVAPFAFSGLRFIYHLHFQEGLKTIADLSFAGISCWPDVYLPASVKKIGENLFEKAQGGISISAPEGSAAWEYASRHEIPFNMITEAGDSVKADSPFSPSLKNAKGVPKIDKKSVREIQVERLWWADERSMVYSADPAVLKRKKASEIRLVLRECWPEITADADGKTRNGYSPQTGLYGMGYTKDEAVLRGYDRNGKTTGVRTVAGNFVFSLPGAVDLGLAGDNVSSLYVLPYEPVFVSEPGTYRVDPEKLHYRTDGTAFQFWVSMIPESSFSASFPYWLNLQTCGENSVFTTREKGTRYTLYAMSYDDRYLVGKAGQILNSFDGMKVLYDDKELNVTANRGYGLTKSYGERTRRILTELEESIRDWMPEGYQVQHIEVAVNGKYPLTVQGHIDLDDDYAKDSDEIGYAMAHEMFHAIQVDTKAYEDFVPEAWREGTAEYFSHRLCREKGYPYSEYPDGYVWDFLSKEDRADIGRYFCEAANHNVVYPLGYYFVDFVIRTYGQESFRAIETELHRLAGRGVQEEKRTNTFIKTIRNATEKNVFKRFVKEVIR